MLYYQWQDRFRLTAILGSHLGTLATAAFLLCLKALSKVYPYCSSSQIHIKHIFQAIVRI